MPFIEINLSYFSDLNTAAVCLGLGVGIAAGFLFFGFCFNTYSLLHRSQILPCVCVWTSLPGIGIEF